MTARYRVPLLDPETAKADHGAGTDARERLRRPAGAHWLEAPERARLPA